MFHASSVLGDGCAPGFGNANIVMRQCYGRAGTESREFQIGDWRLEIYLRGDPVISDLRFPTYQDGEYPRQPLSLNLRDSKIAIRKSQIDNFFDPSQLSYR